MSLGHERHTICAMVDFKRFALLDAPVATIESHFLATPMGPPRALLIYLHGHGERAETNGGEPTRALRGNPRLIPNILEGGGNVGEYVRSNFVVALPQAFLDRGNWDVVNLWRSLKTFYGKHVGAELSGRLFITGVSMGAFGTWSLAGEAIQDRASPFRLQAVAAVDVHAPIVPNRALSEVRALGMRTPHIRIDATERALQAVGQGDHFIDRTRAPTEKAHFSEAWAGLYGDVAFYEWLLQPDAPLPLVPWA